MRQRTARRMALWMQASSAMAALNQVGDTLGASAPSRNLEPALLRELDWPRPVREAWQHVLGEVQRVESARRMARAGRLTGADLLAEVSKRSGEDHYSRMLRNPTYVPFVGRLMAEPGPHSAVKMLEALPPEMAEVYREVGPMLLDPPPEGLEDLGRRFDGVLGPRSEWVDYLGRPEV